jgi:cytosine/adenosine deaminase-related metal-dependent hydrolase
MLRLRAVWVYPVTAPPIPDGAVLVDDRGLIAAIGLDHAVPRPAGAEELAFPEGALVPGLVNCHTHLELTHLAGQVQAEQFLAWVRCIRDLKDKTSAEDFGRAAEQGVRDCWAAGVTCVADTGSTGAVMEALHGLGGRGVVYQEVFGPDPAQCEPSLAGLTAAVERLGKFASARVQLGVSPHAPYTVSEPLYRAVADFARREKLPIAAHIAESREESALIWDGSGPFADALRARGIAVEARSVSPIEYLLRLGVYASSPCLCIHCVQVDQQDMALLKSAGVAIAHCPRSNRAHGHGVAPLAAFRAAGLRVGLGTDSVVSTGDVKLWDDALAAGLAGEDALRMVTLEGARALGLESEIGSLEVGKQADLAVFSGAFTAASSDRLTAALSDRLTAAVSDRPPSKGTAAIFTTVAGRVVHG